MNDPNAALALEQQAEAKGKPPRARHGNGLHLAGSVVADAMLSAVAAYARGYEACRRQREARSSSHCGAKIYEGTNDIQRLVISRSLS
jgi:hypothetical protein